MADHHRAELFVDAPDMAASPGRLQPGCAIHCDRGRNSPPAGSAAAIAAVLIDNAIPATAGDDRRREEVSS